MLIIRDTETEPLVNFNLRNSTNADYWFCSYCLHNKSFVFLFGMFLILNRDTNKTRINWFIGYTFPGNGGKCGGVGTHWYFMAVDKYLPYNEMRQTKKHLISGNSELNIVTVAHFFLCMKQDRILLNWSCYNDIFSF